MLFPDPDAPSVRNMGYQVLASQSGNSTEVRDNSGFPDRWLPWFRKAVLVTIVVHLFLFVVAVPFDYQYRINEVRSSEFQERFTGSDISVELFAGYNTTVTAISGLLFSALGILILLRRPKAFMPLFVSLVLVIEGTQMTGLFYSLEELHSSARWFAEVSDVLSTTLLVTFFLIFPNGRFVPSWTRWFAGAVLLAGIVSVGMAVAYPDAGPLEEWVLPTLIFLGTIFFVMIYAQIYRYRRMSSDAERQQVKWVVVGMAAALALLLGAVIATVVNPDRGPLEIMIWFTLANLGFVMIPLAITVAILRYRLFDIDRLINRTLVYGSVTVMLGLVYPASVFLLQSLLGTIAGSSHLAVALSTLLAATVARPLRDRTQRSIDRRFYRTRYNASETIARFSQSIRDEVDLDRLQFALTSTINDTMHPEKMSVLLFDPHPGAQDTNAAPDLDQRNHFRTTRL
jgi:hypothetical protein